MPAPSPSAERPIVLCVDDDATVLEAQRTGLRELLRGRATLEQCTSALEAADLAREAKEDGLQIAVVVSDEIMPDRRGHQLLSTLVEIFPDLRAVMLTGQAGGEDVGAAVNTGALHGFVPKPWTARQLELAVHRALEAWEDAQRLRHAQRMQAFLLEGDPSGAVTLDTTNRITAWNHAAARILPGLALGGRLPDIPGVPLDALQAEAIDAESQQGMRVVEHPGGDGRLLAHQVFGPGPDGAWVYRVSDVTDTIRGREALERTLTEFADHQRRAAMGLMVGSLVHEFRNVLLVLSNGAGFLVEEAPPASELAEEAKVISASVAHATRLVSEVLAFSRQAAPEVRTFALGEALEAMLRLLHRLPGARDRVTLAPILADLRVEMVHSHLEQIVLNLVKNALECGPDTQVVIEVTDAHPPHLLVRDDGPGMDEATAKRLFEPFFTTKAPDQGTGLGLATCARLAAQAGATLAVRETSPSGTTFALSLPVAAP